MTDPSSHNVSQVGPMTRNDLAREALTPAPAALMPLDGLASPRQEGRDGDMRRRGRTRSGKVVLLFALILAGLSAFTVWNVTRSEALEEARHAYARGNLVVSLHASLDHLARRPWSRDAALLAGRCLSRLDYPDDAEPYYRRAGRLSLNDLQVRAYGVARSNQRQRAIQAYEEILARWPDNVLALRRLAGIQMTQGNAPEVLKLADRLIGIPESEAIGYTLRGIIEHDTRERTEAIAAFERVLELDPDLRVMPLPRRLFWSDFSADLLAQSHVRDVIRYLPPVLEKEPDATLMTTLGRAYSLDGDQDRAEQCFRQAAGLDPSDFAPLLYLGKLELHHQRREEALKHIEHAVELAPRNFDANYTLALAYRQFGRKDDADEIQKRIDQLREQLVPRPPRTKAPVPRY